MCLVTKARMSMSDNFALELFSGIGGMSLGLHSAGFKTHGFDASDRAVAMANENGLASTVVDVFDPDIYEQDPYGNNKEILQMENVFLSPHIAGGTAQSYPRFFKLMVEELDRFLHGHETLFDLTPRSLANRLGSESTN